MKAFQLGCGMLLAIPLLLVLAMIAIVMITNGGIFGWIVVIVATGIGVVAGIGAMSEE